MGKLVLHQPDGTTRDFPLSRERITIGRRVDNDICLPFPAVSGEHAAVVTILDDSFLEDLNSTNGTLVNGKPIAKHFLRDQDEIDIGRHRLVYYAADEHAIGEPPPLLDADAVLGKRRTVREPDSAGSQTRIEPVAPAESDRALAGEMTLPLTSPAGGAIDTAALFGAPSRPEPAERPREAANQDLAPADAPTLEVLDGPSAGRVMTVARSDFVIGRVGVQVATIQRDDDGYRLVHVEGDAVPLVNGKALPSGGAVLKPGDEILIAGTRIRCARRR